MKKFLHVVSLLTLLFWALIVAVYALLMLMYFTYALAYPLYIKIIFLGPIIMSICLAYVRLTDFLLEKLDHALDF